MDELTFLLTGDPVLRMLRPKLERSLQGPISATPTIHNKLDAVSYLIELLREAGFTPRVFDVNGMFDHAMDRLVAAGKALFTKLIPLVGTIDVDEDVGIVPKEEHTGSSRYASAESDIDSNESIESISVHRMSLGRLELHCCATEWHRSRRNKNRR